ncbi:peptidase C1B, bleomycin hydrolase [Aspergillus granulosus]|uniref:Cysteine proteinase 1, mitochondrial n=1 Tax=Aspergillus granulosus TaxID=176169 RepID=A0ABR4H7K0_9EURO
MGSSYSKPVGAIEKRTSSIKKGSLEERDPVAPPYQIVERPSTPSVSLHRVQDWTEALLGDPKNRLALSSLATSSYTQVLANRSALNSDLQVFNVKVPFEGAPITNQRSSGRCWLFASTNIFRLPIMKTHNLREFELSQAYLFYWDKIEKANWFLETVIETAHEDLSGRLVQKLLEDPVTDGGQWDMVANLVHKYGLVPHALYPDSFHAQNSSKMNWLITAKLREHALILRRLAQSPNPSEQAQLESAKQQFLQEIHTLVTLMLGPPPSPEKEFVWQFVDADGKAREVRQTPLEFARPVNVSRSQSKVSPIRMFSLVNDPRNEYNRLLTVDKLGNIVEGRRLSYVNVDMPILKKAVIAMLKAGFPVFFGCDVGKFSERDQGVMDPNLLDLTLGFNISLGLDKAERLSSGESAMTHAMVITAVHLENDQPVRWRVENSWGETSGDHGWFVMTDKWMDEYTFQAVVDSSFVSREVREVLDQDPKVLPRWDPMGVLA